MVSSIETPFTFLQKPVEIIRLDTVVLAHVSLGLIPKVLDPIDVVQLVSKEFRVINPVVIKVGNV